MSGFRGRPWPTDPQRDLLRAAMNVGQECVAAWERWKVKVALEDIDGAAYEVAPLVARNLSAAGYEDEHLPRLKGIARRTWYRNQILLAGAAEAIERLQAAGIECALLKGATLLGRYYGDVSLRPMADVDVLVRTNRADEALRELVAAGWEPRARDEARVRDYRRFMHAVGLVHPRGGEIDLHWHVLEEGCTEGADEAFWAAARSTTLNGVETRQLAAPDLLLHVLVHGIRGFPSPSIRWIVDARLLLAAEGDGFDWERVVRQARDRQLTLAVSEGLRFLRDEMQVAVPAEVIGELERTRPARIERIERRIRRADGGVFWTLARDFARYLRLTAGEPRWSRPLGYPVYLQHLWGAPTVWHLPLTTGRRVVHRLRHGPAAG